MHPPPHAALPLPLASCMACCPPSPSTSRVRAWLGRQPSHLFAWGGDGGVCGWVGGQGGGGGVSRRPVGAAWPPRLPCASHPRAHARAHPHTCRQERAQPGAAGWQHCRRRRVCDHGGPSHRRRRPGCVLGEWGWGWGCCACVPLGRPRPPHNPLPFLPKPTSALAPPTHTHPPSDAPPPPPPPHAQPPPPAWLACWART